MKTIKTLKFTDNKMITVSKSFWNEIFGNVQISLWDTDDNLLEKWTCKEKDVKYHVDMISFTWCKTPYFMTKYGRVSIKTHYSIDGKKAYHLCRTWKSEKLGVIVENCDPATGERSNPRITVPFEWNNCCPTIDGMPNWIFAAAEEDKGWKLLDIDSDKILLENCYPYLVDGDYEVINNLLPVEDHKTGKVGALSIETGKIVFSFKYEEIIPHCVNGKTILQCFTDEERGLDIIFDLNGKQILPEGIHSIFKNEDEDKFRIETIGIVKTTNSPYQSGEFQVQNIENREIQIKEIW